MRSKSINVALLLLLSPLPVTAQTDIGCQPRRCGKCSAWSQPVSLAPVVHSTKAEYWPSAILNSPRGAARNLGPKINSTDRDNSVTLSGDGHWLIFDSARVEGGCNEIDCNSPQLGESYLGLPSNEATIGLR